MARFVQKRNGEIVDVPGVFSGGCGGVPAATFKSRGLVKPDNLTITVSDSGVLTAPNAGIRLPPPVLDSASRDGDAAVLSVSAIPVLHGTVIEKFEWSGDAGSGSVVAENNRAVISVTGLAGPARMSVHSVDSVGNESVPAEFGHVVVDGQPSQHGQLLCDDSGRIVAVVVGSHASGGVEPWNIFGKRVWLAVGTANVRGNQPGVDVFHNITDTDVAYDIYSGMDNVSLAGDYLAVDLVSEDSNGKFISNLSTEAHMDAVLVQDSNQDSRKKTDILVVDVQSRINKPEAAVYCRTIMPVVDGVPTRMDLPRQSVLARIFQARNTIDVLDPSANTWWKLSTSWGGPENKRYVWSSTLYSYIYKSSLGGSYDCLEAFGISDSGNIGSRIRGATDYGVIPVLEIPAE